MEEEMEKSIAAKVDEMHEAVDVMWSRLVWGYAGFAATLLLSIGYLQVKIAVPLSLIWVAPWLISTFRVRRTIKAVNKATTLRDARRS
jgi:tellurite resistance protein TehA-like permease